MSSMQIRRRAQTLAVRSPDIDGFLSNDVIEVLYKKWKSTWEAPIMLSGGTESITCDMVKEIGFQSLSKVYGVKRAKVLMTAAESGAI